MPSGDPAFPGDTKPDDGFYFPGALPADESEEEPESAFLCAVPAAEAESLCVWLESEGIPCSPGAPADASNTLEGGMVHLFVEASELANARKLLADQRRPRDEDPEEHEFEEETKQALAADWICPICRTRTMESLPLPHAWRTVRYVFLTVLIVPPAIALVVWATGIGSVVGNAIDDRWKIAWVATCGALAITLVFATRERYCTTCGWQTGRKSEGFPI
jgi:hypothetical protein